MRAIVRILVGATLVLAVAAPTAALAHQREVSVVSRGPCSADGRWRLGLATDGDRIGVGFMVDASVPGELWRVRIAHDRFVVFAGRRIATEPDGIFGVRLMVRNLQGPDVIRARAVNTVTGETCFGRAVI
jgi:hypothetical protein